MEADGRSKVFISYSRVDLAFTNELAAMLELSEEFEILLDRVGIGHGEAWRERLGKLIVECDTMVFVLSPDSVSSEVCAWEIGEARRLSKRIIPVLWRAVDFAEIPEDLSAINAVPFDGEHAVSGLPKLIDAINSDLGWLREHTRLGGRAVEWEQSGRATAYLLRGPALSAARDWLAAKPDNAPDPTALQLGFIQASEEEERRLLSDERRRLEELEKSKTIAEAERDAAEIARANEAKASRRVVRATATGLIVALVLLAVASGAGWLAYQKAQDERAAAELAEQEAARAALAAADANAERDNALLVQSRFLARAAQRFLATGDAANAIGLARAALPKDLANPDRPFAIEAAQVIFDAYGRLRELATLRGHTAGLDGALALAGERILTWGRDGRIRWWRADGTLLQSVLAHQHPTKPGSDDDTGVHGVLVLADGRLLSWGADKTAKIWSDDAELVREFLNEQSWIRIKPLADGRIGALIGNEFRVWSAELEPLFVLRSPLEWMKGATALTGGRFLTWQQGAAGKPGNQAYTAMLWRPDGRLGAVLEGHERSIRGAFELAGGRIVTFDNRPGLRIWSADGQLEKVIEKVHDHVPWGTFAFPLRDGRFYTWGQESYHDDVWWGRLWTAEGDSEPLIEASDAPLQGFELDDGRLLLGTNSRTPAVWHADGTRGPVLRGHEEVAYGAEQWPDGRIATRGADHTARLWSRDGTPLVVLRGHEGGVSGIEPLSGERVLTWSYRDRTARIWGEAPQPRGLLQLKGGAAKDIQQLASGTIAVYTNTGSIELIGADLGSGPALRNDARDVIGLVELQDGRLLTRGANYSNRGPGPALRMWSATGEPIADLAGPAVEFLHVAPTPSGDILGFEASGQVWLWRADGELQGKRSGSATARPLYRVFVLDDGRFVTFDKDERMQLWTAVGEPDEVLGAEQVTMPKQIASFGNGQLLQVDLRGLVRVWSDDGDRWLTLDLGDNGRCDTVTPLQNGKVLLNLFDGRLVLLNADRSLDEIEYPQRGDHGHVRHDVVRLADGRLMVSTSNHGTHLWSADGKPGQRILDTTLAGASMLSDGAILVWPGGNRYELQIISPAGDPGPVLRGHEATISHAFQLSDGRILSWAEDASVRVWPGSVELAIAWADDVIARLEPLTLEERCDHYLESATACAEVQGH